MNINNIAANGIQCNFGYYREIPFGNNKIESLPQPDNGIELRLPDNGNVAITNVLQPWLQLNPIGHEQIECDMTSTATTTYPNGNNQNHLNIDGSKKNVDVVEQYKCTKCEYTTLKPRYLQLHRQVHEGDMPFICRYCRRGFTKVRFLRKHDRNNRYCIKNYRIKCSVCFKAFPTQHEQQEHEKTCKHPGYQCFICRIYTTNLKCSMKMHMRSHSKEKLFPCYFCSSSYTRIRTLEHHLKGNHDVIIVS